MTVGLLNRSVAGKMTFCQHRRSLMLACDLFVISIYLFAVVPVKAGIQRLKSEKLVGMMIIRDISGAYPRLPPPIKICWGDVLSRECGVSITIVGQTSIIATSLSRHHKVKRNLLTSTPGSSILLFERCP